MHVTPMLCPPPFTKSTFQNFAVNSLWPQFVPKDGDIGPEGVGSGCCGDRVWHLADTTTMCTSCWDGRDKEVEMVGSDKRRLQEAGLVWLEKKNLQVINHT